MLKYSAVVAIPCIVVMRHANKSHMFCYYAHAVVIWFEITLPRCCPAEDTSHQTELQRVYDGFCDDLALFVLHVLQAVCTYPPTCGG